MAFIFLQELYIVSQSVIPELRDGAMDFIMTEGLYDPNARPEGISAADLLPVMNNSGKAPGLQNPGPSQVLDIDVIMQYAIQHGRPGINHHIGVVIDLALRVNWRSIFGYRLVRALAPEG